MSSDFKIKIWGVRKSMPAPLDTEQYRERLGDVITQARDKWSKTPELETGKLLESLSLNQLSLLGGDTPCVEVRQGETLLVLDMGTGARRLGYDLMAGGGVKEMHVLMTHMEWDHIQGWPFFIPGYLPTTKVHFYSSSNICEEIFIAQQKEDYFPVPFTVMSSEKTFHKCESEQTMEIGPFRITPRKIFQASNTIAYRVEEGGRSAIFLFLDSLVSGDTGDEMQAASDFFASADVLITCPHYLKPGDDSNGEGLTHSMKSIAETAKGWGIKKIIFTQFEPNITNNAINKYLEEARSYINGLEGESIEIDIGREDMPVEF